MTAALLPSRLNAHEREDPVRDSGEKRCPPQKPPATVSVGNAGLAAPPHPQVHEAREWSIHRVGHSGQPIGSSFTKEVVGLTAGASGLQQERTALLADGKGQKSS